MRRFAVPFVVLVLAACASGGSTAGERPSGIMQPDIEVKIAGNVFFGGTAEAPITFDVFIRNRAAETLNLREIEITAPNMSTYSVRPARRNFNETIQANEEKKYTLFSTVQTLVANPREPLSLRTYVTFETDGLRWREMVVDQ
ncbi:MAG TPA: hypothetical protein VGF28_10750 [Thermoanaerobaculia bacterium]|jgi:hypothetical protein